MKNLLEHFRSRVEQIEGRHSKPEGKSIKMTSLRNNNNNKT